MDTERFARLAGLFDEASELDAQSLQALIEDLRVENPSLASDLTALLAADAAPQPLLDEPLGLQPDIAKAHAGVAAGGKFGQFRLAAWAWSGWPSATMKSCCNGLP